MSTVLRLRSHAATVSQQIFGAYLFLAIFGLVMFGRKFVAAEILFSYVQCDSVYRRQHNRPKICARPTGFSPGRPKFEMCRQFVDLVVYS